MEGRHFLALSGQGEVYSWGSNVHGCLGNDPVSESAITQSPIPGLVGKHVIHIACGSDYSAAVTDEGEVYTWGCGENGRLGHDYLKLLLYFGTIKQQTGEDWNDAKLSLSTAMPSVGGSPPDLETLHIGTSRMRKHAPRASPFKMAGPYAEDPRMGLKSYGLNGGERESCYHPTEVKEGITSTTFEIARRSTVKTDNTEHKVSICQINLKPTFEYTSVPKLVAHAFLKAKVTNDSNYALLAGPANVFLDNNFLTKSSMEAVSPLEEFDVSLGVDPAVKITYKPLKKFKQSTGILSKYRQLQCHQEIVIKNTKLSPIKLTVTDQLPLSSEEKLKVNVMEPVIPALKKNEKPSADQPVKLNDKNNVEWTLQIPASGTKEINLKYTVEHPANLQVTGL
eukprot:Seg1920.2 transcript_id=Seg1920.2/GoldUCD/mRNA.D3Y31 product="Protein F37C4.5" protein_id=Seg1920.2/GoldUCD/D3Y31